MIDWLLGTLLATTALIVMVALNIIARIPFVGCLFSILSLVVWVGWIVLAIMGAIKAYGGVKFRYPWSLKLIK